tara:strand:+ start:330 stop:623 length:294 start_codon:yes stop_codon:yes gene_type:complete
MRVEFGKSKRNDKRLVAVFYNDDGKKVKTTHFGMKNPKIGTFIDHQNKEIRELYLKRHRVRENWDDYQSGGSLARHILWNKPTLEKSIIDYKNRFNL